jgi:hypothetical protein
MAVDDNQRCARWAERKTWSVVLTLIAVAGTVTGCILIGLGVGQSNFVSRRDAATDFSLSATTCTVEEVWARMVTKSVNCGQNCRRDVCYGQVVYTFSNALTPSYPGSSELAGFRLGGGVGESAILSAIEVGDNACVGDCDDAGGFQSVARTGDAGRSSSATHSMSRHLQIEHERNGR